MNFIDLQEQFNRYKTEIENEIASVLKSSQYILGPKVRELEDSLSHYLGIKHSICCASGTDALLLGLLSLDVQRGDEIILPDFTFFATAEVVALLGAKPVFIDISEDTYNINTSLIESKITDKTVGIIPVSLYGQCAELNDINDIAQKHGLWVMEDAAQSFGATHHDQKSCALTRLAATSFYPSKPLGCYGDGGAIFTADDDLAQKLRMYLNHGQSSTYQHKYIGINGRMDSIQAAILGVKLKHFNEELIKRQHVADIYFRELKDIVTTPSIKPYNKSVWAQFTLRSIHRKKILTHLKENKIPTAIHYPTPLHKQEALQYIGAPDDDFKLTEKACQEVFSIPMHPFLSEDELMSICHSIKEALHE